MLHVLGEERHHRFLLGKRKGKGLFGRHSGRWEDNIKMHFQKVVCGGMDWIELAQDRLAGICEYGSEPSVSIQCGAC